MSIGKWTLTSIKNRQNIKQDLSLKPILEPKQEYPLKTAYSAFHRQDTKEKQDIPYILFKPFLSFTAQPLNHATLYLSNLYKNPSNIRKMLLKRAGLTCTLV